jgi:anaerobic ribonucleoside-triphosphate reductase activating protein
MKYWQHTIVFQEMPKDVALAFELTNCPFRCDGCHSPHLQEDNGYELTVDVFKNILNKYVGLVTAVLFLGSAYNDVDRDLLMQMLDYAKTMNMKTCIWTGEEDVCPAIKDRLDFLKVGQYRKDLGGISDKNTNQRYFDLKNNCLVEVKL